MEPTRRTDFVLFIQDKFEEIQNLFARKNEGYGASDDLFWNFRQTAERLYPSIYAQDPCAAMFLVAETLVDKHNVAPGQRHCGQRMRRAPAGSDCVFSAADENDI
ncbi:MAG: hypothetical protein E6X17_05100 [Sporomusaceae bacterium]|nr:hypothetical protein [Sporomusaceae bacterium]